MQEGHACRAQDAGKAVIPDAPGVGQRQREDAGCSQDYQVDGDVGLYWTSVQMCNPCDAGVKIREKMSIFQWDYEYFRQNIAVIKPKETHPNQWLQS